MSMSEYPAGRDLDAIVAAQFFGYQTVTENPRAPGALLYLTPVGGTLPCPAYSTDPTAAWTIVEYFHLLPEVSRIQVEYRHAVSGTPLNAPWYVLIERGDQHWSEAQADTMPLATCWAALRTRGVKL